MRRDYRLSISTLTMIFFIYLRLNSHKLLNHTNKSITVCPEKRLPFEVQRECRTFEFKCFNSLNEHIFYAYVYAEFIEGAG